MQILTGIKNTLLDPFGSVKKEFKESKTDSIQKEIIRFCKITMIILLASVILVNGLIILYALYDQTYVFTNMTRVIYLFLPSVEYAILFLLTILPLTIASTIIGNAAIFISARIIGGKGTFVKQMHLFTKFVVPFLYSISSILIIVGTWIHHNTGHPDIPYDGIQSMGGILSFISLIFCGFYSILITKENNEFDWIKSFLAALITLLIFYDVFYIAVQMPTQLFIGGCSMETGCNIPPLRLFPF